MMTIEHIDQDSVVTVLDTDGVCDDIEAIFDHEGYVWFRQFGTKTDNEDKVELIRITFKQFKLLIASIDLKEGAYR